METHQVTCEIYICRSCTLRFKKLSEVKAHIEKEDADKRWNSVEHAMQDREIIDEISTKKYDYEEL